MCGQQLVVNVYCLTLSGNRAGNTPIRRQFCLPLLGCDRIWLHFCLFSLIMRGGGKNGTSFITKAAHLDGPS